MVRPRQTLLPAGLAGLGLETASAFGLGVGLGWWADSAWGTLPILTLAGAGSALTLVMVRLWRFLQGGRP